MTQVRSRLPSYDQLLVKEGAPPGSAWGLFGNDGQARDVGFALPYGA
jgi:hypothetical protein